MVAGLWEIMTSTGIAMPTVCAITLVPYSWLAFRRGSSPFVVSALPKSLY